MPKRNQTERNWGKNDQKYATETHPDKLGFIKYFQY